MHPRSLILVAVSVLAFACAKTPPPAPPPSDAAAAPCTAEQFVACKSGEDCTRKNGIHVHAHACLDHAAEACASLACKHGCNIHGTHVGGPKEVFCAINEAGSSQMKRCGGFSGWQCPENMTCETTEQGFDVMGTCVPNKM